MRNLGFLTKQFKCNCRHHGKTGLGKFSLSSRCLGYEVQFLCEHLLLEIFFQQRICCSNLITWVNFSVSIDVKRISSLMGNVLAEDCNRLWASLCWSFWFFKCAFLMLGCKRYEYKPQCQVSSTKSLLQKIGSNMAASEILIRGRSISVRVMSDVEADNIEQCDGR